MKNTTYKIQIQKKLVVWCWRKRECSQSQDNVKYKMQDIGRAGGNGKLVWCWSGEWSQSQDALARPSYWCLMAARSNSGNAWDELCTITIQKIHRIQTSKNFKLSLTDWLTHWPTDSLTHWLRNIEIQKYNICKDCSVALTHSWLKLWILKLWKAEKNRTKREKKRKNTEKYR